MGVYFEGWQEGLHYGRPEGQHEGRREGFAEIAINLLQKNLEIPFISEVTGLPEKEILKLKNEARPFVEKIRSAPVSKDKKWEEGWWKNWRKGWKEGWLESWREGRLKGLREARMEAAFKMLQKNLEIPFISKAVSMLEWEIHKLKHEGCPLPKKEALMSIAPSSGDWPPDPIEKIWKRAWTKGWRETRKIRFRRSSWQAWQSVILNLLKEKADLSDISKATGLPKAEIIKFKNGKAE